MKFLKLKTKYIIILFAIVVKLTFQFIATANSGYHGDELLHIEAGKHLAFGYMDFPPFIGFVSWVQDLFHSDSLFINHLFNYAFSVFIILICGLTTIRLGGGIIAVIITESSILFSPGFGASQYLFLPTAFEQLFWVLFIYFAIGLCNSQNSKNLIYIALFSAIGFLNKYSIAFLFVGFVSSILLFNRELLGKRIFWIALVIFIILILPNPIWQFENNFPIFHHMSELYKTQLDKQSFLKELMTLIVSLNPFAFIVWLTALIIVPFHPKFKVYKLPVFTLLFSFLFLMLSKGKSYYFYPIVLSLLAFGSVYFEHLIQNRKWIVYGYLLLLISFGLYILPHGLPLLKLNKYIEVYNLKPNKDNKIPLTFENYYSDENWDKILESVSNAKNSLSENEREHCLVWGRHYSIAGGINLLGKKYNLPNAFSFHSSFYTWVPDFNKNIVVIAISESNLKRSYWEQYFDNVEEAGIIENHYASEENWYNYRVFVCRELKYNSEELKKLFKDKIF
ncbi:ArnT family glycosyltransferase [Williamwhitmania taraxaci]|uniref:Dolichyl-phosphate-mannose-protein mannosyltransferase n=1 Tax=Williamwhitmania taraxaci TaxID=1640674 RepID=A0A1G6TYK4_9BACT|nr:glycosyltransferase family 39 protein [Williamwhitmania taraxaci]SDD34014.1 Dolichyl-phosphate-mannose-protein mannosyltransferase [Williamwhitmania taraxaci]